MTARGTTRRPPRLSLESWWLGVAPLGFLAVFFAWPTTALIARGLGDAVGSALPWSRMADAALTTLTLSSLGMVLTLAIGLPAAWALFRRRWPGARFATALATVPFVLPTIVVATAFRALTRGTVLADTKSGMLATIVAAFVFFNVAVVVRVVGPVWAQLDDRQFWAARTLGASSFRAAMNVHLPALTPAIVAAGATVWLFCSSSFGVVIVLGGGSVATIDTEIWLQANRFLDLGAAAFLGIAQILVVTSTLLIASLLRGRLRGNGLARGATQAKRPSGPRGVVAIATALTPALLVFAVPLSALVWRSVRTRHGIGFDYYARLFDGQPLAGVASSAASAAGRSLTIAVVTATVATTLALAVALVATRRRRGGWLHIGVLLPLGVSSVVVGLGSLLTLTRRLPGGFSLVDANLLVPAAHIVVALPLAATVIAPALRAVDPRLRAAAATLGASPLRVFAHVEWPLIRRSVAMAAGIAAAVSLGEFGATTFLVRPGAPTLPTLIFHLLGRPGAENLGMAFAACVLLAGMTLAVAMVSDNPRAGRMMT